MSKLLMESLKLDMPALAKLIQARGRKGDTILAHISPKEAALLKKRGGSGTINPDTGLPEFDEGSDFVGPTYQELGYTPSPEQAAAPVATPEQMQAGGYNIPSTSQPSAAPQAPVTNQTFANTQDAEDLAAGKAYGVGTVPTGQALPTGGTAYAPTTLTPIQLGQAAVGQQVEGYPGPKAETAPQTFLDKLGTSLSEPANLAKLGLVGGLGVLGTQKAKQAAAQNQAAQAEQAALGAPYQQMGNQMVAQGQAGELTPSSQAAYQAAQARLNQDIATRGGVGVQQAANQSAALYSQLLQNQTQYGLQVAGIGDSYQINAIQTGLALDQQTNQNLQNYYAALSAVAFGIPMRTTTP